MAENNQQRAAVTAAFPPPPPFWKHFTPTNVEKLEEIKKAATGKDEAETRKEWTPAALRALPLPPDLGYLVPPEPPTAGSYKLFSEWINISTEPPSLQDQGVEQLYPSPPDTEAERSRSPSGAPARPLNHAYYLLKISKSLLLNFLEFVGLLAVAPQDYEPKMMDIHNLFINAHHLLNLYRPHQARESLIVMMEEQLAKSKEEISEMDRVKEKVESVLEQLRLEGVEHESTRQRNLRENGDDSDLPEQERRGLEEAKELWKLLDELDD